ncbi:DUF927 domain-containing protein [Caballeronia sp. INML2]|uniref:DUF927 domain-containing protein n=1 Tax=Caballeronia sp. INML2 TaxID=2921748 RepID=UPI0020282450|nr:DUF927 domain-containing protein [Caballeronia sp. INML2]
MGASESVVSEVERIRQMLAAIPPDIPYPDWLRIGTALKTEFGDAGFGLFDSWSQGGVKYCEKTARATWRNAESGTVRIGTVKHIAKENGYADGGSRPVVDRAEVERKQATRDADRARNEAERVRKAGEAAKRAQGVWNAASPARDDHPYLQRKGLAAVDTLREIDAEALLELVGYAPHSSDERLSGRILTVPVMIDSSLSTVELIDGDGRKSALKGGAKSSGFWSVARLPEAPERILVAEGCATAMSAHACTDDAAVASLSAGNMTKVAKALRERFPDTELIVLADVGNGEKQAHDAAKAVGGVCVVPDFGPDRPADMNDFDDLRRHLGVEAVREQIGRTRIVSSVSFVVDDDEPDDEDEPSERFEVRPNGVFFYGVTHSKGAGKAIQSAPLWLCDEIEVVGRGEDEQGHSSRILRWKARGSGDARSVALPLDAVGEREGWSLLRRGGLAVSSSRKALEKLADFLQTQGADDLHHVTARGGWQHGAYVLPDGTVIGKPVMPIFFGGDASASAAYAAQGTVDSWRESVARLTRGNSRPALALGAAFGAPLLDLVDYESGGFHLFGKSGSGKTTSAKIGASVWGNPRQQVLSWDSTALALSNAAAARNDGLMLLDEMGQGSADAITRAAYVVFNGQSRMQGAKEGGNRSMARWRVMALSTGEIDLAAHLGGGGHRVRAGQEVRLASLPSDAGKGLGAFDTLHEYATSGELAEALDEAARLHHGTVGRAFIGYVAARRDEIAKRLRAAITREQDQLPDGTSGQVRRVVARFAVAGEALEIATDAGLLGWKSGEGHAAVMVCFKAWLSRFGTGNREDQQIIERAEYWFGLHAAARFIDCRDAGKLDWPPRIQNAAGYFKPTDAGTPVWLVIPGVFADEIAEGFDKSAAADALEAAGMLRKARDGKATSTHKTPDQPGLVRRFYVFTQTARSDTEG